MNTISSSTLTEDTSEVFVLPLIPLIDFSSSSSVDEEDSSAGSAYARSDFEFVDSSVEAMN